MVNTLESRHPTRDSILNTHQQASSQWWGCNWATQYGPRKLNLLDVRSRQARLIANATSGEESSAWDAAAAYLSEVELDAAAAQRAADKAVSLIRRDQWQAALIAIEEAVTLETKHRPSVVWGPLRDEIKGGIA